jgi:predicted dehydrogenase
MIKVGIIGCGKIADAHAAQIKRISGCEIVGVCDKEILMAKQLFERFEVKQYFGDLDELLNEARPDVIHITTPPQSHYELGRICLEAGCHVYIEKPFTVNTSEAVKLINLAKTKNLKITAGHDDQFTHATRRMRELVKSGYIGGDPVHMESYYCYDLGDPSYAQALLGDKKHWIRALPGKLLQNVISHGISRIAEYVKADDPQVIVNAFTSPFLKSIGETEIVDELRVIVNDNDNATAYFTFSSQMRPILKYFRVFGHKNGLTVNHDQQTVIKLSGKKYKSYLEKFIPPVIFAKQYAGNFAGNVHKFLRNDFHMKSGMKFLIESFYRSISDDTPVPLSYKEILLTSKIMDEIFLQINSRPSRDTQDNNRKDPA